MMTISDGLTEYWKALMGIVEKGKDFTVGEILDFKVRILGDKKLPTKIMVRRCYLDLLKFVIQITGRDKVTALQPSSTLILGTPGIGKSFFGHFLVPALFLNEKSTRTIIYESGPKNCRFLFSRTNVLVGSRSDFMMFLQNPSTFYIADSCKPQLCAARSVLITSPLRDNWNEFKKYDGANLYMPPWSQEEILMCGKGMYSSEDEKLFDENFRRWGGVARYVFEFAKAPEMQNFLEDALARCNMELIDRSTGEDFVRDDISHRLIHIFPKGGDYTTPSHDFASKYVRDRVGDLLKSEIR